MKASRVLAPIRPTVISPPRSTVESIFTGFAAGASPGPMTLVSRFFSDNYPDSGSRSFSQLLACAMASPVAVAVFGRGAVGGLILVFGNLNEDLCKDGGVADLGFKQMNLMVAHSPLFTIPPGLSPSGFLNLSGQMKTHGKDVNSVFNKKVSSFALYEGRYGEHFIPYQVSRKFYHRDKDKKIVAGLRKWLVNFRLDTGQKESLPLREIKLGERNDLVCKILHICEVTKDEWMAFVWDGTDTPPVKIETRLEDEKEHPLPLHLEPLPLPRDAICMFPTVGTILRVIGDRANEKLALRSLNTGKWVKFLNIIFEVHAGLWRGVLMPFTKVLYIPSENRIVSQRQRSYDERVSTKWDRMPFSSFDWPSHVTEIDYEHVPFVTLMDVLTFPEATAKFKCVVRVAAVYPWQAEDFCSPSGTYRFRLTLEDSTARIHAFVYAEDGEKFLEGYPSIDVLKRKRNKLLGVAEGHDDKEIAGAPRNPPWVQCCLKSYYLVETDVWGSRNYRIFGTRLVG